MKTKKNPCSRWRFVLPAITWIIYSSTSNAQSLADGVDLVAGSLYERNVVQDGDLSQARFSTPRHLKLTADRQAIFLEDENGYTLRKIDKHGVTTILSSIYEQPKEIDRLLDVNSYVFANPLTGGISKVDSNNHLFSVSGELLSVKEREEKNSKYLSMTDENSAQFVDESPRTISNVIYEAPVDIQPFNSGEWIVLDKFGTQLKLIKQDNSVINISGLEDIFKAERFQGLRVDAEQNIWLYNNANVVELSLKEHQVLQVWNNNTQNNFTEISDLLITSNQALVVDKEAGAIKVLMPNNNIKTIYQSPCSSAQLAANGYVCNPALTQQSKTPLTFSPDSIVENPWHDGYVISSAPVNALFNLNENGELKLFAGELPPESVMTDLQKSHYNGACMSLKVHLEAVICTGIEGGYQYKNGKISNIEQRHIGQYAINKNQLVYLSYNGIQMCKFNTKNGFSYDECKPISWFEKQVQKNVKFELSDVVAGQHGEYFVTDELNRCIYKITLKGRVSVVHRFPKVDASKLNDCNCNERYRGSPALLVSNGSKAVVIDQAGYVYDFNMRSYEIKSMFKGASYSIGHAALDVKNRLWVTTRNLAAISVITSDGKPHDILGDSKRYTTSSLPKKQGGELYLSLPNIHAIDFDKEGSLWVGTASGLIKISQKRLLQVTQQFM